MNLPIKSTIAAAVAAFVLASPAALPAAPTATNRDACFVRRDVSGFSAPNDHTVYLRVGVSQVVRLDLMTDCTGLSFRNAFGLEDSPATPWICSPLEATVISRDGGIGQRCPVKEIHKLTPDEVAALPKRDRP